MIKPMAVKTWENFSYQVLVKAVRWYFLGISSIKPIKNLILI